MKAVHLLFINQSGMKLECLICFNLYKVLNAVGSCLSTIESIYKDVLNVSVGWMLVHF